MPECPTCHKTFPTKHDVWQHWMMEHKPAYDIMPWEPRRARRKMSKNIEGK